MRIMPMGDSNTAGVGNPPWPADGSGLSSAYWIGYRLKLKQLLEAQGVPVDFVGSQSAGGATFADCQHEGWPGDGVAKIQARVSAGVLESYNPDVVLLLIGSNDMWVGLEQANRVPISDAQANAIVGKLSALVIDMTTRRPGMLLLIGKPPTPANCPQPLAIYRAGIDQIVAAQARQGRQVGAVDMAGAPNDGVHYTPAGHDQLAARWAATIHANNVVQPPAPAVLSPPVTGGSMPLTANNVVVTPASGDTNTLFRFTCNYNNPAGVAPAYAFLVVAKGGNRRWIAATPSGDTWATGVTYTAQSQLEVGTYTYQFEFKTGTLVHWANPLATASITVTAAMVPDDDPVPLPTTGGLKVAANKRYLVRADGTPFLWLGDTAWTALSSLSVGEFRTYLDKRKAQGFTVIQLIGAHWGAAAPLLADGHAPFLNSNPTTLNPNYWSKMDTFVALAAERGLICAMAPAWWDFVTGDLHQINAGNAREFGRRIGARYASVWNVVYLLGGDCKPTDYEAIFNLIAEGILLEDGHAHLISFHPGGGGTGAAAYFPQAIWLDFSMIQSGHSIGADDAQHVTVDYAHTPIRPVVQGEANYEACHPWPQTSGQRIDDREVRRTAYSALLSGACGYTYGANGIFQFYKGGESYYYPRTVWTEAMDFPGAVSMTYLRQLFESVEWWKLVPANIIGEGAGSGATKVIAARASDNSFAMVYVPVYNEVAVVTTGLPHPIRVRWYDPRTGQYVRDSTVANSGTVRAMTPESMGDPDYVLVLSA